MASAGYYLGIDFGTSGARATVIDGEQSLSLLADHVSNPTCPLLTSAPTTAASPYPLLLLLPQMRATPQPTASRSTNRTQQPTGRVPGRVSCLT